MLWGHAAQVCVARRWGASVAWGLKRLPPPRHAVDRCLGGPWAVSRHCAGLSEALKEIRNLVWNSGKGTGIKDNSGRTSW